MQEDNHDRHDDAEESLLDVRGLKCPLPVLKTRKALSLMDPLAALTVLATDPMSAIDIPHMCQEDGHELISHESDDGFARFVIRKSAI